ncbi:MAG TPA: hypothetical protein VL651_14020 [Bacteroidia bacterium]|nr:hypothetical protein [Bacteroidia bacterium]
MRLICRPICFSGRLNDPDGNPIVVTFVVAYAPRFNPPVFYAPAFPSTGTAGV